MEDQKPDDDVGTGNTKKPNPTYPPKFAQKLPAAGWGLFFIWIGK